MKNILTAVTLFLSFMCATPALAYTPVQVSHAYSTTGSVTDTMSITDSGDALVITLECFGTTTSFTLTSITNNGVALTGAETALAFSAVELPDTDYAGTGIYFIPNASGSNDIAATVSYSSSHCVLYLGEMPWTGAITLDQASSTKTGASTSVSSNSITPAENGEYLVGALAVVGGSATFSSWNSPFAKGDFYDSNNPSGAWAYGTQSTAASINVSATSSQSADWWADIVSFKPASSSTCTHAGQAQNGSTSIPNGSSGSYWGKSGNWVTPDCATINYWQPSVGNWGVN